MMNLKRSAAWAALFLMVQSCAAPLEAGSTTYFGFSIGVNNAPPPPRVVVVERPQAIAVGRVYLIENSDYDTFQYGSAYYCYNDGYWYRARNYNGPFVVVDVRSVPRPILDVPAPHWKHHPHGGPPGQMKRARGWH